MSTDTNRSRLQDHGAGTTQDLFVTARRNMITQQIRPWDVLEPRVLDALEELPRHWFVPPDRETLAYVDLEIPLPEHQVMLAPKVEARLLQELDLGPADEVLEVGTGSGYMAALMGLFAKSVLTVEKYERLARFAEGNLAHRQCRAVTVLEGNGLIPDPRWSHRPFDVIMISGGVEQIPDSLVSQLKPGGRLIALVGRAPVMQATLIERAGDSFRSTALFDTLTLPLEDQPIPQEFVF
ncbi:MAG: protein-L-isoaspartate O-methyltransferase family protein [Burkholderiaceae bacterium]